MKLFIARSYTFSSTLAEALLTSELLPRKIELEQRYLQEALEILTSTQVNFLLFVDSWVKISQISTDFLTFASYELSPRVT